jgi:hypothetical protein
MLVAWKYRTSFDAMELRRIIPTDMTASAIVHVSLLMLVLLFSEVHPFGAVTAEQIPVEIVTPQELAEKQAPPDEPPAENKPTETKPEPQPDFSLLNQPAATAASPPAAPPAPAAGPQKQAALAEKRQGRLHVKMVASKALKTGQLRLALTARQAQAARPAAVRRQQAAC